MKKLIIFFGCLAVWLLSCFVAPIRADELDDQITEIKAKLNELQTQKSTLSSAISYLDNKIELATISITQSEKKIETLEGEIGGLSEKIGVLDQSLGSTSQLLLARIIETYKKGKIEPLYLFLTADGFSQFLTRYQYLKVIQTHDRNLMYQMEQTRFNYDSQKTLKEEKQAEIEAIKTQLEQQKITLAQQKAEKEDLLIITQNSELQYQRLLAQAEAQLAAFRGFIISQGGAAILDNQTKCDSWGCYYNQRDSQWGNMSLGGTQYSMKDSGCFVTSVAMLANHYGKNIKPSDIADIPAIFTTQGELKWEAFNVNGVNISITGASKENLDQHLASGNPVIVELSFSYGEHFIIILKKEGDQYIMHDPFLENGSYHSFSDEYSVSNITSLRLVSFN